MPPENQQSVAGRGNVIGVVDGNEVVRTPYGDQVWSDLLYPGGMVCAWCGAPVESEPCAEHGSHG